MKRLAILTGTTHEVSTKTNEFIKNVIGISGVIHHFQPQTFLDKEGEQSFHYIFILYESAIHNSLYDSLNEIPEGDLLVIAYKLAGNRIPAGNDKHGLINRIVSLLKRAGELLSGQTLPADLNKIDKL